MKSIDFFILGAVAGVIGFLLCFKHTGALSNSVRQEAIQHGAAYWTINPETGEKTFTWKQSR